MPYLQQFESVTIETKAIEQYCKEVLSEILLEGFFLQFCWSKMYTHRCECRS